MASINDVARYILEVCGHISVEKLQTMCYHAQKWHNHWTDKPLLEELCEKKDNTIIYPTLLKEFKGKEIVGKYDIKGNSARLNANEKSSIEVVCIMENGSIINLNS